MKPKVLRARVKEAPNAPPAAIAVALKSAALLRGGVHPRRALLLVSREVPGADMHATVERVRAGWGIGAALAAAPRPEWRVLGAAWSLAEVSGAPLAPVLERIAAALGSIAALTQRRDVLLQGPRTTVRLVATLPFVAIGVGYLLGFDPFPVFITPIGMMLVCVGLVLHVTGLAWTRALTQRVANADRVAGLECELYWVALAGGSPPGAAISKVADAASECGAEWIEFSELRDCGRIGQLLESAMTVGVPVSQLLLEAASTARAETQTQLEREAERLGVRVLMPLAMCTLPAFVCLGIAPVVISLLGGSGLM